MSEGSVLGLQEATRYSRKYLFPVLDVDERLGSKRQ